MSLINRILKPGGQAAGWNALDVSGDGLFGVSVLPPGAVGAKPLVVRCAMADCDGLVLEGLEKLAKGIGQSDCGWVVALDRRSYSILVIEEPAVRADEMTQSVRWAISNMIDYPSADAAVGWMRIPTEKLLPNRPSHIYAVAARNETMVECQKLFKEKKLSLKAIDVQETAHRNIAALVAKPGEGVVLLAVGRRGVQLTVTFQGELYLDRHVDEAVFGSAADEVALERACERVVLQVQRSLDFIGRTLPFIDVSRILLAPMESEFGLAGRLSENLPLPVEVLDLANYFDFSRTPELLREEVQSEYFVALGSALRFLGEQK